MFTWDVLVCEFHGNIIISLLDGYVFYLARSIPVVLTVDLGLRGAVDGKGQASLSGSLHVHGEGLLAVCDATLQTRAIGLHPAGIAARFSLDVEWTAGDGMVLICDINRVWP